MNKIQELTNKIRNESVFELSPNVKRYLHLIDTESIKTECEANSNAVLGEDWRDAITDLIDFCDWIIKNVRLCDRRCQMSDLLGKEIQECTRLMCLEVELECLVNRIRHLKNCSGKTIMENEK